MNDATAPAAGTTVIMLHIDIEGEDCWVYVPRGAPLDEIYEAFARAEAAGLEPIPEEEDPIDYTLNGWTQHFKFTQGLMLQLGMVS